MTSGGWDIHLGGASGGWEEHGAGNDPLTIYHGFYLISPDGTHWLISVDNNGSLVTSNRMGYSMGLLLSLTYAQ